jgi:hypothetical protein
MILGSGASLVKPSASPSNYKGGEMKIIHGKGRKERVISLREMRADFATQH